MNRTLLIYGSPIRTMFRTVMLLIALVGVLSLGGEVRAQCGNYVIYVDENGQPVVDHLLSMSSRVDESPQSATAWMMLRESSPVGPDAPCSGWACRKNRKDSLASPPPLSQRKRDQSQFPVVVQSPSDGDAPIASPFVEPIGLIPQGFLSLPLRPPESRISA